MIFGLEYVELGLPFWFGLGSGYITMIIILMNKQLYYSDEGRVLFFIAPLLFGAILYFCIGILMSIAGWLI